MEREMPLGLLLCLLGYTAMCLILGMVMAWAMWSDSYAVGYHDGQVDAIQGNVKYELRDQHDGSRVWVETERGK